MYLQKFFPILNWLPQYSKSDWSGDVSAGITVGIMLIPQGMAYAGIAGLPPIYGLYAALFPQVVYAILGTSRQLSVGPVAMDSLLVATSVSMMATIGSEKYIVLACTLAFLMGIVQILLGWLRLGFLVNFLSRPVMSAFTSGAAIIIAMTQIKHFTGISLHSSNHLQAILYEVGLNIRQFHWITFGLGVGGVFILGYFKKNHPKIPGALVVVTLGILITYFGRLDLQGVHIIQKIPQGFPAFQTPMIEIETIQKLLPTALALALIAFMEAFSVAQAIQIKHKNYEISANQELIALGSANAISSFFQCFPTTGGFSRTAVNNQAGAKTNVSALISALIIGLTLVFLTPLFYYLPQAVLASIILVAVANLVDMTYPQFLWKYQRTEFWLWLITFVVTLTVGILEAIIVGVFFSLAVMIAKTMQPHVAVLGRVPHTDTFRNIKRFSEVETRPDVLIMRYDADLYFANIQHFKTTIHHLTQSKGNTLKVLIINTESIDYIDSTALFVLEDIYQDLSKNQIQLFLTGVKGPVRDLLLKVGFTQKIGVESFFIDEAHALDYFDQKVTEDKKIALQKIALQTNHHKEIK